MSVRSQLAADGVDAPVAVICRVLGVPRSTVYYTQQRRGPAPIDEVMARQIWRVIQECPAWGIRKVWGYLRNVVGVKVNRKKVARIMRIKGWTLKQRRPKMRPRVRGSRSVAERSNQRWATDVTHVYCGREGWCHVPVVIDCADRELIGWRISRRGTAQVAEASLEDALIRRFGPGAQGSKNLVLRSDNGLIFLARSYRRTVADYGLSQEFITPYTPEQNGVVERVIKTLKEECVWIQRFEGMEDAEKAIAAWVDTYNTRRPHESLGDITPMQWRELQQSA